MDAQPMISLTLLIVLGGLAVLGIAGIVALVLILTMKKRDDQH